VQLADTPSPQSATLGLHPVAVPTTILLGLVVVEGGNVIDNVKRDGEVSGRVIVRGACKGGNVRNPYV